MELVRGSLKGVVLFFFLECDLRPSFHFRSIFTGEAMELNVSCLGGGRDKVPLSCGASQAYRFFEPEFAIFDVLVHEAMQLFEIALSDCILVGLLGFVI